MNLECFDSILVIGRHENNEWNAAAERFEDFKAGHAGHLDIEEDHVGFEFLDQCRGLRSISGFSDDLHIALLAEKIHQLAAGRWFVVDNEYAHGQEMVRRTCKGSESRLLHPLPDNS